MPRLAKTVSTTVAAALFAACPVVATAADAHPAPRHGTTHTNTQRHVRTDKFAGLRHGMRYAITAQLKSVTRMSDEAASLALRDGSALQGSLTFDANAIRGDYNEVDGADSVRALHALLADAITSRQVARVQFEVVVAADAVLDQTDALAGQIAEMQGELSALDDVTMATAAAALNGVSDALNTLTAQATGAVEFVLLISPDASRSALHTANVQSQEALEMLTDGLAAVQASLAGVQSDYGL
jgi:hypothetical protein